MSDSVRPHRRQPTRLPRPWDSPGKNTGVGCHFLLQCMKVNVKVKSLSRVLLFVTPWTAAYQAPPSMGCSRQEYWSGLPLTYLSAAAAAKSLQSCPTLRSQRRQPTRLLCPWDSRGKNAGVGCHFFLQCLKVKSESEVDQSCPTLCDPVDCSLPGSSTHGIFWAKVLEWGAIAFSLLSF